jgi:hypothetical protein
VDAEMIKLEGKKPVDDISKFMENVDKKLCV